MNTTKHTTATPSPTKARPRRPLMWLALGLLCCQLTGCDNLGKQLNQWFPKPTANERELHLRTKAGFKLFQTKKYEDALQLFLQLQSEHPQRLDLMYNLGATHLRLGESTKDKSDKRKSHFKKAETYLSGVLTKGSASLRQQAHYNLGILFTHKHQYEKALYHFEQSDYLASKVLKQPDPDASKNRDLLATLLRQRNRRRQKLNRTRVFRYEAKVIQLRATKAYQDPVREIALQATFTHQGTGTKQTIWGYPISDRRWQVRFIPTRTGKWRYKIKTIKRAYNKSKAAGKAAKQPAATQMTVLDKSLQDEGLFRVMPSARAGRLIIATANPTKFAWKKPKSELKLKQKKTKGTKGPKGQPAKGPKAPKAQPTKKGAKAANKKGKQPELPKDETIIRWHGIEINGLFHPKQIDAKRFAAHLQLLGAMAPTAIHVPIHIDQLLRWPKQPGAAPQLAGQRLLALTTRLKQLRANPTHRWAFVYNLQSKQTLTPAQLQQSLAFLTARLGHIDAIWSTSELPKALAPQATKLLEKLDPYKQPIAATEIPDILKAQMATQQRIIQRRIQMQAAAHKAPKVKGKQPKAPKLPPIPKINNKRFVLHTSHDIASTPKRLQTKLICPWITDLPVFVELDAKGLRSLWWKLYVSGMNPTITLERPFHADELKDIVAWLEKAEASSEPPAHPDTIAAKAAKAPTSQPVHQGPQAPGNAKAPVPAIAKTNPSAKSPASRPTSRPAKAPKPQAKRTPKAKRISRPLIHYLIVRHRWFKFVDSFRFAGLVRPMMVQVRVPDMKSFRAAIQQWQAQQSNKGDKGTKGTSLPAKKPASKPAMPKMQWQNVGMRGYLAGNVTTILFLAPTQKAKKPPQIRWKQRRMDMEFSWYNAEKGTFLDKQVFRQVLSLALVAPKKKAHIAKVVIKDHHVHTPYEVALPHHLAPVSPQAPWQAKDWQLLVKPPKGPQQRLTALLTRRGYIARFRPDAPGFWSFTLLYKGKRLKGKWGYDGVVKAVPAQTPVPLLRHPKMPKRFLAGTPPQMAPVLVVATPIPSLLDDWSDEQAITTIQQIKQQRPATNLLIAKLPALPWKGFTQATPKAAPRPTPRPASRPVPGQPKSATGTAPAPIPIAGLALAPQDGAARLQFLQAIERLERRLAAIHKSGRLAALMLTPSRWKGLAQQEQQRRMFFLLDRFATAYPLLWLIDHRDPKSKPDGSLTRWIKIWYMMRYPHPSFKQKAKAKAPQQAKQKQVPPSAWPPLVGAAMGSLRSEKQLKQAKAYDFLWLEVDNLMKDIRDFKLHKDTRPILLTWKPLLQADFQWKSGKGTKRTWDQKQLKTWARFLWRAQLMGFSHTEQPLDLPLVAPAAKDKTKSKDKDKPQAPTIEQLDPPERIPAVMQAFFQTFDWSRLTPPIRSMGLKDYQAFGAETPYQPKGKSQQHHAVIWVNKSVRKGLLLTQKTPLKKHRYVWLDPLTGQQPVSPQLLPLPPKGKPNTLQVPFRPALLYVFRRPPQKQKQQKRRKQQKKQKKQRTSKRQRVRNKLKNLKDDRNKMLKKMLGKQKPLSGKRG